MEYRIVSHQSAVALAKLVQEYISIGWVPSGGIAIDPSSTISKYLQAMTREAKE